MSSSRSRNQNQEESGRPMSSDTETPGKRKRDEHAETPVGRVDAGTPYGGRCSCSSTGGRQNPPLSSFLKYVKLHYEDYIRKPDTQPEDDEDAWKSQAVYTP